MSNEAITWALAQPVKHSSAKFVLVVMANRADGDMVCWPSMADVCKQTSQDRKTVQENIRRLREAGFIEDTGTRKGSTKQVIVYRLKTPKNGPVEGALDASNDEDNDTENGSVKEAQKRNTSENGTGPNFPHKRPEIPGKEAQISRETGPKTGHGTIKEPSMEPSGKHQGVELPAWLPESDWNRFCAYRLKASGKKWTLDAELLNLKKLTRLRDEGQDPVAVINESIANGWSGLFGIKQQARASPPGRSPQRENFNEVDYGQPGKL